MSESPLPSARQQLLLAKYGPFLTTPFFFGFSAHVLTPNLFSKFDILLNTIHFSYFISINRFLGARIDLPLTNTLWFGSHIGISMYLYTSKHLRNAQPFERLLYTYDNSI
jgi:hypothetical protein